MRLAEYSGQALSYGVLQEWAELGIGSAILPQSKLAPSVQPKIPLTHETGPLQINHRCLWIENGEVLPAMQRLAGFLRDAVPGIVKGSVR